MSGIVGILNGDGQPLDPALLQQMTELMAFRGPDARDTWTDGYVGFGHALLRTTWESATERQPHSLDEKLWITGDIRLYRREDLIDQLRASRGNLALYPAPSSQDKWLQNQNNRPLALNLFSGKLA